MRSVFVTGSAGFIGYHLCERLLGEGFRVTGYDGMSDYYDVALKQARHERLSRHDRFTAHIGLLEDRDCLAAACDAAAPDIIVHLAAQAGVRYSIENPRAYLDSNITGSFNLMECALAHRVDHLLMASTSSVYGANETMPYGETDKADSQMSFYAATKKANEAMAHAWAHIHDLPVTMFRFFTVYGPWGRPDMALFKFTDAILNGRPIDVYNRGEMWRDFTYVEDLVRAIALLIDCPPPAPGRGGAERQDGAEIQGRGERQAVVIEGDSLSPVAPWRVVNIGNSTRVKLTEFIAAIEAATGRAATRNLMPMQQGDVPATWAEAALLQRLTGYRPETGIKDGTAAFVKWYRAYYGV